MGDKWLEKAVDGRVCIFNICDGCTAESLANSLFLRSTAAVFVAGACSIYDSAL